MARKQRFHEDSISPDAGTPRYLSKQQFAQRLHKMMREKGWHQSELARQAGLPRDSISVYLRGKSLPSEASVTKLAAAFGVQPADILPNMLEGTIRDNIPTARLDVSTTSPDEAWVQINRLVRLSTALKIMTLIESDPVGKSADPE